MAKIQKLSLDVISKIAAGEVIERPAFAVKELLENAIDAKADFIEIIIENGGLKKIEVKDNGVGMSKDDLEICFLPHTTSKLLKIEDLHSINTLGFRGEALSSMAAIANVTIQSRTKKDIGGTSIVLKHGKLESISSVGIPPGTIVTVEHLFSSIPARKKFLKSEKTEFRIITEIVMSAIIANPHIHFVLTHDKKTILDIPKTKDLDVRLALLFGEHHSLLPLILEDSYIKLKGFIGKPQSASSGIAKQYIFVNNRTISDKIISLAVKEAFGTLLPAKSFPLFLFFITVPPHTIDINVHPRKETIEFTNAKDIFELIKTSVLETLQNNNITFNLAKFKQETSERVGETHTANLLKEEVLPFDRLPLGEKDIHSVMQLHQTYIFVPTKHGMYIIDQHAAHERILFEQFRKSFEEKKKKKNTILLSQPFQISLSISEIQILEEYQDVFTQIGFEVEPFQGKTFVIRSIPEIFKGRNIKKIIEDMFSDIQNEIHIKSIDTKSLAMLSFLSCRAAIKAGDALSQKQIEALVSDLENTKNNTTCPHGRPTKIFISKSYLDQEFKR